MLIDKMFELAEGVLVEETTITEKGFEKSVYQKPPDRTAIQYLADRIMGKPTERTEADVNVNAEIVKAIDADAWNAV